MATGREVKVTPVILIDGQYYDCDSDTMPLDGVQVRWGRQSMMDKPQAATAELRLFDKTSVWVNRFRDQGLVDGVIGKQVHLQANLNVNQFGVAEKTWTWFRGNITHVEIEYGPSEPGTNEFQGYLVTIQATDPMAILGEVYPPVEYGAWPAEDTLLTRANYLRNDAMPYAGISDIFFKPANQPYWCSATTLNGKTMGALVDEFYQSQATQACYSPKDNAIRDGQQFFGGTQIGWFRYSDGYTHIAPKENPRVGAYGSDTDRYYGTSVSGAKVTESGGAISRNAASGITQWKINYYSRERGQDWNQYTAWAGTSNLPRKIWQLNTWLTNDIDVNKIKDEMGSMLQGPIRLPSHPSVNFNTSQNGGGFESVVQAMNLIMAGERQFLLYVSSSPWHFLANYTPTFGVVGGVIRLEKQQWDIDLQLQPYSNTSRSSDKAHWDTIPTSLDWGDATSSGDTLAHGISWRDTRSVQDPYTIREWADD